MSILVESESIVEKKCLHLLKKALYFEASDIHFLPSKEFYQLYFRKYNRLIHTGEIPLALGEKMISHFKYQSALDISEKRRPQSGSFEYIEQGKTISCRISTLPAVNLKESIVIRLMIQNMTTVIDDLAISQDSVIRLKRLAEREQGIVIFCGPTGCGKSTSMYSLLNYCTEKLSKHVISLEDPVENNQQKMLQIQVNEQSGVTYSVGLKAILRHSPDVIMIGEIRDKETAKIAIEAALTGHLVLTTIHAKNSFGSLHRLLDLGVSKVELEQTVAGIVSQKLVSKNNEVQDLTAVFEILDEEILKEAITALKEERDYQLPIKESISHQIIEGIRRDEIVENPLST